MLNSAEEKALDLLGKIEAVVAADGDPEGGHIDADNVLVQFVRELGYEAVADAWGAIQPKWYA